MCIISKVHFEIPHKLSYIYIEKYVVFLKVMIWKLTDLWAHKVYWNPPEVIIVMQACENWTVVNTFGILFSTYTLVQYIALYCYMCPGLEWFRVSVICFICTVTHAQFQCISVMFVAALHWDIMVVTSIASLSLEAMEDGFSIAPSTVCTVKYAYAFVVPCSLWYILRVPYGFMWSI